MIIIIMILYLGLINVDKHAAIIVFDKKTMKIIANPNSFVFPAPASPLPPLTFPPLAIVPSLAPLLFTVTAVGNLWGKQNIDKAELDRSFNYKRKIIFVKLSS